MPAGPPHEIQKLLADMAGGDRDAANGLFTLVYDELRRLANVVIDARGATPTLQPTALVHEAFVRLVGANELSVRDRQHFMALAGRVMRQLLVDHARAERREKRGGGLTRVTFSELQLATPARDFDPLALEDALEVLAGEDPSKARLVELRFFAGMTNEEAAEVLGISASTLAREWRFTRAWLAQRLAGEYSG